MNCCFVYVVVQDINLTTIRWTEFLLYSMEEDMISERSYETDEIKR